MTSCPAPASSYSTEELNAVYMWTTTSSTQQGVATANLTLEAQTQRPSATTIQTYVNGLYDRGLLTRPPASTPDATGARDYLTKDAAVRTKLQEEYCFYYVRYQYALKTFLEKATSGVAANNAEALRFLEHTKTLNLKLNSILEVMNYLAQERVGRTNMLKTGIDTSNAEINTRLSEMQAVYKVLSRDDALVRTQREMVRYTEEKNAFNANQISLWAAANVVALAVIFYVYRS